MQKRIIIGAGITSQEGWLPTNESELNLLDDSTFAKKFKSKSVDAFLAEHVWEHMTESDGIIAAKICYKYLKPGGYIRCAVPDINFNNEWYQEMVQVGGPGPEDHPAYSHKIVYDYKRFKIIFEAAGFDVELLEYCDENHDFHYNYWNPDDGMIGRSYRYDTRNKESLGMVSIIIDAKKKIIIKDQI
jgi:predicted SAM-dependent methyltransferase